MLEKNRYPGPPRDFVGYGPTPPFVRWPGDALLALNLVLVYEEGAEYWIPDGDASSDNWGEFDLNVRPGIRDLGTETHFEYGSRAGIWRIARLCDRLAIPVTVAACAQALERNPAVVDWLMSRGHDILGHGYRWVQTWEMSSRGGGARPSPRNPVAPAADRRTAARMELPLLPKHLHPRADRRGGNLSLLLRSLQ